ncbi:tRNA (guanosine(46)-N7)-methyltransferase TrmB [Bacillus marinisedimentorum]|uniref:tRNA (guanosine(46)-N7)-methyltransferase TrmB n=1 Tax=Bacillus marinisedimentorum TaxID=1821260 RepID=UPI0008730BF6|nr:tRNA (guanosine(46)-N7)-methyltransferase TrmB [Bacillus marinisedimentorum]
MRQRHKPWAKDKIKKNSAVIPTHPESLRSSWAAEFGNGNPIHLEIGTGKGRFVAGMAEANPAVNFIGIEKAPSVIINALDKVLDQSLENIRLLNEDANDLTAFFGDSEVSRIYLNFSDPWPKNRHEKRRLTYETFLAQYEKVLCEQGEVHLKTDNQGLFEYSLESFSKYGMVIKNVSLNLHDSGFEGNIMTEYEQKFSSKGMRIYRCEAAFR